MFYGTPLTARYCYICHRTNDLRLQPNRFFACPAHVDRAAEREPRTVATATIPALVNGQPGCGICQRNAATPGQPLCVACASRLLQRRDRQVDELIQLRRWRAS